MFSKLRELVGLGPDIAGLVLIERARRVNGERLAAALLAGDDSGFRTALSPVERGGVRLWDEAHAALQWTAQSIDDASFADRWPETVPDDAEPLLVRAVVRRIAAWEARGSGFVDELEDPDWATYERLLGEAQADAARAAELAPESPLPWAVLAGIRLSFDLASVGESFEGCIAIDPLNYDVHQTMLYAKGATWYGSNDEMLAFARGVTRDARAGSPLHALLPHALSIRWTRECDADEEAALRRLMDGAVTGEVVEAYSGMGDGALAASELERARALNWFAWYFYMADQDALAAEAFTRTGRDVLREPWELLGDDALKTFARSRKLCKP